MSPRHSSWIDGHCHLADPRFANNLDSIISRAGENNISSFIQGGVDPEDWTSQLKIQEKFGRHKIRISAGLHPWWVATHNISEVESSLNHLEKFLKTYNPTGFGEMGLDFQKRFSEDTHKLQEIALSAQLELNVEFKKPLILHVVRAHDPALKILKSHKRSLASGIVHSFSGNWKTAKTYLDLGFALSISGFVGQPRASTLHQCLKHLPLESLVIESDCPDQPHPKFNSEKMGTDGALLNEPLSIVEVAKTVGEIKGLPFEKVLEISSVNLVRIFSL